MTTQIQPVLTIDDLDLMPEDGNRYELIEGEIYMSRAPSITHQCVIHNFQMGIGSFLNRNPIGLIVPGPGVIFDDFNGVIPDIVFVSNERRAQIISGERFTGAPDLVIEIISPGAENERRDRIIKRRLYGQIWRQGVLARRSHKQSCRGLRTWRSRTGDGCYLHR